MNMADIYNSFRQLFSIKITDIIDILIVAFVVYKGFKLIRETRAAQLIKGIVILLVATQVSDWLHLNAIHYILINTVQLGMLALLVVFQPELRRALEHVGRKSSIGDIFKNSDGEESPQTQYIHEIAEACRELSRTKTGALIVMERKTKLGEIINTGTIVDARVSSELLQNIFFHNSPLHDGAVIVKDGRVYAAGCYLPLTEDNGLSQELGTRHRAAIGMSETADCAVVVVSEETGKISIALAGNLRRSLTPETLYKALLHMMVTEEKDTRPRPSTLLEKVRSTWKKR